MTNEHISIKGARQNNLKGFDLDLPLRELIVVTGVSGSGKSSLAFDTLYAEGQRRYVETFSPYARQFLERMDKPKADRIDGIPPAIAIDQTNPVRTSRSTVGTMTELNDHLKLLFARGARLRCGGCGRTVRRDTPESVANEIAAAFAAKDAAAAPSVVITFPVPIPKNLSEKEVREMLEKQGYTRIIGSKNGELEVARFRTKLTAERRSELLENIEAAFKHGHGRVDARRVDADGSLEEPLRFSSDLHCAHCDIHYRDPVPNLFSFNSPIGACDTCRGFGRVIGVDYALVIPDESLTLAEGAVKPWRGNIYSECLKEMRTFARKAGIPMDVPWRDLTPKQRAWVIDGVGDYEDGKWYGIKRFFEWLESKSYKMHVRVMLSRYRSYTECETCGGARLKPEALNWRLGDGDGLSIHNVMLLPIDRCLEFFTALRFEGSMDEATDLLLTEIRTRLGYLVEVGVGYLTLDRQSRTLSGGEVQRINLTTALGTSLVNTLFVLDEPSIGLHPRDIRRLVGVLRRLRGAGNTLLVVEHDPEVIMAADRIIDLGPGPGERGGEVVFNGPPRDVIDCPRSLTGDYLAGRRQITQKQPPHAFSPADVKKKKKTEQQAMRFLEIVGAADHNLKNIDVRLPLNQLVCLSGVSGSGKSTLMKDICHNAMRKIKGKPADPPGAYRRIVGHELVDEVELIDQSPLGRTTRSNPASYVGAFDTIRKLFVKTDLAKERGYTAGSFSFNSGDGRCPTCGGNGFQHVEMQFLSDVYLRCPDCDGRRYRPELLEVTLNGKNISDVLEMTVSEAVAFFSDSREVAHVLEPLVAVGLDYLRLGQPATTLSGGEAQRLKLAGHLAERSQGKKILFLFDEPTTGLHFDDIAKLLGALRSLVTEGHSVVVIEHNLDVIQAADWIIDLGPEGGDAGGEIVCEGTPAQVARHATSHTGEAMRHYAEALKNIQRPPSNLHPQPSPFPVAAETPARYDAGVGQTIRIHNAREHNLQGIDIEIPLDKFTVVTGISGSGKSTVAFDILFAEGQRRYLESLNAYARQFVQPAARPDVDAVLGIPPTVAIEQRTSRGGRKSTVATVTEIHHFLRLLFVKLGVQQCPECDVPITPQTPEGILAQIQKEFRGKEIELLAPLIVNRKGYYTDLAKWAAGKRYEHLRVDGESIPTDTWPRLDRFKEHTIQLPLGRFTVTPAKEADLRAALAEALQRGKSVAHVLPLGRGRPGKELIFSTKRSCHSCGRGFPELDPRLFSYNSKHGWCPTCFGTGLDMSGFDAEQTGEEIWWNAWWEGEEEPCPDCGGRRLNSEALAVRVLGKTIADYSSMPVEDAEKLFASLRLKGSDEEIARDLLAEIRSRLSFLHEVGLSYLSLDRAAPTLSGGEAQRIRLAAQLGSNLRGVCYILDEPTIGLHARDNKMLLSTLRKLEAKGNTVVVVEHDEETIRQAEHIIDLGPGAGVNGGRLIAEGTVDDIQRAPDSLTGKFLREPLRHPLAPRRPTRVAGRVGKDSTPFIEIVKANLHNLKDISIRFPLGRMICVTGVSGSGKSTLARDILHDNLRMLLAKERTRKGRQSEMPAWRGCADLKGVELVRRVMEVDQTPIGKTPRSCPATYIGFWDDIRRLFAATPDARVRGFTPSRFSFNVKGEQGGRCPECDGQGYKTIEMSFLPDVSTPCDACGGKRFNTETLEVLFKDKTVADALSMSVEEAVEFFSAHPQIHRPLQLLNDVGLGYLSLGQQSPTLSGGEAQRIKLVTELHKTRGAASDDLPPGVIKAGGSTSGTLYILDEPTVGLHMADVEKLIRVLHRLVNAGNTVVVIEHNLDVIAEADWIIDLGPEGGSGGGRVVAEGPPEKLAAAPARSHTAEALAEFLARECAEGH